MQYSVVFVEHIDKPQVWKHSMSACACRLTSPWTATARRDRRGDGQALPAMSRAWPSFSRFVSQPGFIVVKGIRTWRERVAQTLWYEGVGLVLVSPLYAWASGSGGSESLMLLVTLSLVVMAWTALYNTLFDFVERRCIDRVASDRSRGLRTVHAVGLESSAVLLTCPVILVMTDSSLAAALLANLGLTAIYAVYGYAFHLTYDRLRPVASTADERVCAEGPSRAR